MDQRFPKEDRLRTSAEFDLVFAGKCSVADPNLVVYIAKNEVTHSRIGLVVSKKVGNAVHRNRWKRQLRAIFRTGKDRLPTGVDLVVIPRSRNHPTHSDLRRSVETLARRAKNKLNKRNSAEQAS